MTQTARKDKGFSLIEVSIAILLIGLAMGSIITVYNMGRIKKEISDLKTHLAATSSALERYARQFGHYPLPAPRNLTEDNANFGHALVDTDIPSIANCAAGGGDPLVCKAVGARDMDGVPGNDPVYIGDVPFATIGLPESYMIDGYGSKLTYAVSGALVTATTFGEGNGSISVIDEGSNPLDKIPPGILDEGEQGIAQAHYVVVSHGKDQKGAFSVNGVIITPCTSSPGKDVTNCNNSGQFNTNFQWHGPTGSEDYDRYLSVPKDANHYDDYVAFSISTKGDLWTYTPSSLNDIYQRPTGNTGIGLGPSTVPYTKLQVIGDVKTQELWTTRLCDDLNVDADGKITCSSVTMTGTYPAGAFVPGILGGTPVSADTPGGGINCGDKGMTGIGNSDEQCGFFWIDKTKVTTPTCNTAAGLYPHGTDSSGNLLCTP